jgi:hypothetical protein
MTQIEFYNILTNKNTFLGILTLLFFQVSFSQKRNSDSTKYVEIETVIPKSKSKNPNYKNYTYHHVFTINSDEDIVLKTYKVNSVDLIIEHKTTIIKLKSNYKKINNYNDGFTFYQEEKQSYNKVFKYHNYIVYKRKNKFGVILNTTIIKAKYDSIGTPFLVKGKRAMILVAKKKKNKLKWGIIDSDGALILPLEYQNINTIIYTDINLKKYKFNNYDNNVNRNIQLLGRYDGLYQNQLIIVKKNDKYGLFSAIGKQILYPEYDKIIPNKYLTFYTLEKHGKYGFLMNKKSKIGVWGKQTYPSISNLKTHICPAILDFKILSQDKVSNHHLYYILNDDGTTNNIEESEVLKLISE